MNTQFNWTEWLKSRNGLVVIAFVCIAAFYLLTQHTAHLFEVLPYALLLLCPLMHLFMHGGHGHHNGHQPPDKAKVRSDGSQSHIH